MKVLNFTEEEQWNIWTIVALVMHLGNVVFGGEEGRGGEGRGRSWRDGVRKEKEGRREKGRRGRGEGGREGNKRKIEERGLDAALRMCNVFLNLGSSTSVTPLS